MVYWRHYERQIIRKNTIRNAYTTKRQAQQRADSWTPSWHRHWSMAYMGMHHPRHHWWDWIRGLSLHFEGVVIPTLLRLCFRPTPADRLWRVWVNMAATLIAIMGLYLSFHHHHQSWGALSSGFMVFWNGVNIWANAIIWYNWKHNKPLPWFLNV